MKIRSLYQKTGYHNKLKLLFCLIISTTIMEVLTIPYLVTKILDVYIPEKNIKGLIIFVSLYILVFIIQGFMVLMHCDMRSILKRLIQRDLRKNIFTKLQYVKAKFYDENTTGKILQFLQDDSSKAGELFPITITEMFVMGLIRFSLYIVFLLFINVKVTLMILSLYIIGFFITLLVNKKTVEKIYVIRKINRDIYSYINEGIQSFFTIKTLGIIEERCRKLKMKLNEFTKSNISLEKIVAIYNNIFKLVISFSLVIIIYFGGLEVLEGVMSYATITLLMGYSSQLEFEFNWFVRHLTDFNEAVISYCKILQLLEREDEELLDDDEVLKEKIKKIEFRRVNFAYNEGERAIEDFSFKVTENQNIALIGRTGSGKTTITNLLNRLYDVQSGQVLFNNSDSQNYSIKSIRDKIGYVMQEVIILPNTIIDNIRYVNEDITVEEIEEIFKQLKLHNKILSLTDGYNTDIYNFPDLLSSRRKTVD